MNNNPELALNPLFQRLVQIMNFLSIGIGIVVVGLIITGGIQYIMAGGAPQKLEAARRRIQNALIALFMFIFMFAILQWLIPGGVFDDAPACNPNVETCPT